MTVVKYHGTDSEVCDELEPGYRELDLITKVERVNDLDDTKEIKLDSLEDTQIINIGDNHE